MIIKLKSVRYNGEDEALEEYYAHLVPHSRMTLAHSMNNRYQFQRHLEAAYVDLFENDPEYAYARARKSPEALADVMTASLAIGEANTDGAGIRRACKAVGIPQTRKAITAFLNTPVDPSRPQ